MLKCAKCGKYTIHTYKDYGGVKYAICECGERNWVIVPKGDKGDVLILDAKTGVPHVSE